MNMKKYAACCCLLMTGLFLYGQSDIDLNHHWLWRLDNNPATIKNNGAVEADIAGRFQWAGFEGAPITGIISVSGFHSGLNSGFGMMAMADMIGFTKKTVFKGMYSYNFSLGRTSILSLGLSGGISQNSIAHDKIKPVDDVAGQDVITYYLEDRTAKPEIDFGFAYTFLSQSMHFKDNEPLLQVGGSVTHLNRIFNAGSDKTVSNYYAFVTGNVPVGNIRIVPGASAVHRGNIISAELNAMMFAPMRILNSYGRYFKQYDPRCWFGGSLKFRGNEIALFAGLDISEHIGMSYSLDLTYASVGNMSRTSHEIMLVIRVPHRRDVNCSAYRHDSKKTKYNEMFNNFIVY